MGLNDGEACAEPDLGGIWPRPLAGGSSLVAALRSLSHLKVDESYLSDVMKSNIF